MDTSTPSPREQGIAALGEGDLDRAIDCLGRAVALDDRDAEARALLGVAYSRKGRHDLAKQTLNGAVELQPRNARYRFNLGAALESAGDVQGAALAYRDVLQIDPEHAQAKARLQALGPQAQALLAGAPPAARPQPPAPAPAAARPAAPPPGTVSCPKCGEWQKPGVSCEFCGTPLRSASSPYGTQAPAPGAPIGTVYAGAGPDMGAGEAFGRRLAAMLLDSLVGTIVLVPVMSIFLIRPAAEAARTGAPLMVDQGRYQVIAQGLALLFALLYSGGMIAARGQTLGKMALGIRVVGPEGGNPSFLRAALRETIGKYISAFACLLGYFWMLWDADQQTWHDKIASTTVERA